MDNVVHRCKGCGIVFEDADQEIDKCLKKRLYCELCLAQKNPWSETEQKIKRKYILLTTLTSFIILTLLIVFNWGKSKNSNLFEYVIGFGIGYLLIWGFTSLLLLPVLRFMKKPHKEQIKMEKEKYAEEIEVKKVSRKAYQEKQKQAGTKKNES